MPTKKLVIGLVLDDSLDTPDGVQQYVVTLGTWLAKKGHEVHYLVGQTSRHDLPNIHSLARNQRVSYNGNVLSIPLPANKQRLRQLLAAHKFDILHVQTPYSPFLAGRLIRMASPQTAIVGSFHIMAYNRLVVVANHLLALANRRTARRFDMMAANSQPAAEFATRVYGFRPQIIPNPFPLATFSRAEAPAGKVPSIVFLGRLVPRKGALQLLQAIVYLRDQKLYDHPFRVVIGGKGPLRPQLESFVADHDLGDVVSFAGFVPEASKMDFLAAADVAVFPSLAGESFGISLLEALASVRGVVLGGDNPGYRAVLQPLGDDHLVNPHETPSFAQQLADWLSDEADRKQARLDQTHYVEQFDIEPVGTEILAMYNQALRQRQKVR